MNELRMMRLGECRVPDLIYSRLFRYCNLVHVAMLHVKYVPYSTAFASSTHIAMRPMDFTIHDVVRRSRCEGVSTRDIECGDF